MVTYGLTYSHSQGSGGCAPLPKTREPEKGGRLRVDGSFHEALGGAQRDWGRASDAVSEVPARAPPEVGCVPCWINAWV